MVSRTVRTTRPTRDATTAGTAPSATNCSTRTSAASRSSLVGARGIGAGSGSALRPVSRAKRSPNAIQPDPRSLVLCRPRRWVSAAEVEGAGNHALVLLGDPVQVAAGLGHLVLQRADGRGH